MIYGSVCSGIEAASVAWHPLGWRPAFFSEIEPFPRAVLAHHYPTVPLHGDFTTIKAGDYAAIDLLVGGTPCQSFSVAGLRGGLGDDRGNLALEFLRLADRLRPRWLVWENVPGVLSSNGGRDFGSILGGMVELGYGFAYRVLDAQYVRTQRFPRAVPQRRRRVFVVGHLGDWRRAAAVLFERHGLSGHPAPRKEARQVAPTIPARSLGGGGLGMLSNRTGGDRPPGTDVDTADSLIVAHAAPAVARCDATREGSSQDYETTTMIAHALRAEGFDASEDGTGRGTPLVLVPVFMQTRGSNIHIGNVSGTLGTNADSASGGAPIAFQPTQDPISDSEVCHALGTRSSGGGDAAEELSPTLRSGGHHGSHANGGVMPAVAFDLAQITSSANRTRAEPGLPACTLLKGRRLTPRECARLQGFPDDYLDITFRGKPAADGPKYKALGNSMAVNVMSWIGERIQMVEDVCAGLGREDAA